MDKLQFFTIATHRNAIFLLPNWPRMDTLFKFLLPLNFGEFKTPPSKPTFQCQPANFTWTLFRRPKQTSSSQLAIENNLRFSLPPKNCWTRFTFRLFLWTNNPAEDKEINLTQSCKWCGCLPLFHFTCKHQFEANVFIEKKRIFLPVAGQVLLQIKLVKAVENMKRETNYKKPIARTFRQWVQKQSSLSSLPYVVL